jgi:hypothetical protein
MFPPPTNFPTGVATRPPAHLYSRFPIPDPTRVFEFFDDFQGFITAAAGVSGWHLDNTGTNTLAMLDEFGGVVRLTLGANAGDAFQYQWALNTVVQEAWTLVAGKRAWFSTCFSMEDVDQDLFFIGLHVSADDITGTEPADQFGVRSKPGAPGTMQFCAGKTNSTEVTADIGAMADGVRYALYAYYDGRNTIEVEVYVQSTGVLFGSGKLTVTSASTAGDLLPDTEMTVAFAAEAVDTGRDNCEFDCIHVARER